MFRRSHWPVVVACMAFLPVLYALSYAPLYRLVHGRSIDFLGSKRVVFYGGVGPPPTPRRTLMPLYTPVEWLIDETPFRQPLLWWADVWSVGYGSNGQLFDSSLRKM